MGRDDHQVSKIVLVTCVNFVYNGKPSKMLNLRDVTEHHQLRKVTQEKNNISMLNSTVTHELMTPINCVATFADRLVTQLRDLRHQSYAKLILRTSKLLKSYIRDLLDRALIEKGKLVLNPINTDLNVLIAEVIDMMQY